MSELTLEEKRQKVAGFRPIDDAFFEVLADDKDFCTEILRVILGNVTGKKAGTATITADDGTHTATFTVTVKAISKAKTAQLNYDNIRVEYGVTYTLKTLNGSAIKKIK